MSKPEHRRAADRSGLRYPAKSMALVEQLIDQPLQRVRVTASRQGSCGIGSTLIEIHRRTKVEEGG
jgi:hypothetical protein